MKHHATIQTVRERYNSRREKILKKLLRISSRRLMYRSSVLWTAAWCFISLEKVWRVLEHNFDPLWMVPFYLPKLLKNKSFLSGWYFCIINCSCHRCKKWSKHIHLVMYLYTLEYGRISGSAALIRPDFAFWRISGQKPSIYFTFSS